MAILDEENRQIARERLGAMGMAVTLHVFIQDDDLADPEDPPCPHCKQTVGLLEEVAETVDGIQVRVYERSQDPEVFAHYGIAEVPTIIPMAERDVGIRFVGLPHGYEFASFLDTVAALRQDEAPEVSAETQTRLDNLSRPTGLKVFYLPTCPHCPRAVRNAVQLARASDQVSVELIESSQFPGLVNTFRVMAVPLTVINDVAAFEGAGTVEDVLDQIEATHQGKGFGGGDEAAAQADQGGAPGAGAGGAEG